MNLKKSESVMADNYAQAGSQIIQGTKCESALNTAAALVALKDTLGLSLTVKDQNLNNISAKFKNIAELLHNTEFILRLNQTLYVSNATEATWFKLVIRNGKLLSTSFLLTMKRNWVKIINKTRHDFKFLVVGYSPSEENAAAATAAIPRSGFTPERILKFFPHLIGETANDTKEIGKLICYILSKDLNNPTPDMLRYVEPNQGFWKNPQNQIQFNPEHMLYKELLPFLPKGVTSRQYPVSIRSNTTDITPVLAPLFSDQEEFQLLLLYRTASWLQFLFAKRDIYADQILITKPTPNIPINLLVAILKNTRYDSLDAPPIGPNIKPLQFDIDNINDGMVIAIDTFRADQVKKAEKGYDLLINNASGATGNTGIHHILALISDFADLYLPQNACCVLEFGDISTEYSPEAFKTALKRLDENLIIRIEHDCTSGDFIKVFNSHITQIQNNIPDTIPRSKVNTYIMLLTALRMYHEMFSPLFCADMKQFIENWLCSKEQDEQPLNDTICSEYGKILNQKITDGYFRLILKDEVTPFDKGSQTIVVDKEKRRIYIETADSFSIVKDDMKSISDTDSLTAALYNCDYLPHNPKNKKSIRIAAMSSDGVPYPLYVHSINYTLLTSENRQRFDLIDKDANLFKYDELPTKNFLPLVKTIDGRYDGKMLLYDAEESNIYFGTGRTGSGKSWAIAQILCMLFMLRHNIIVLDVSGTYTKEKLLRMLPADVVKHLFEFIDIGEGVGTIPIVGSLKGCNSLPDKKNAIFSVIHAAVGRLEKDQTRALRNKNNSVELNSLCKSAILKNPFLAKIAKHFGSVIQDLMDIGFDNRSWSDLFTKNKIIVLNLGLEVGESSHQLLDMLLGSLFNWQMTHDSKFLSIAIDELIDQDFSKGSPLSTIVKQGRKFHTALLGATQDYYNQGSSYLDTMKQANIKSFCRPGKSEERVAQKLGYSNAIDAGFHKFKSGDTILEFDAYNKEIGGNEAITLRGRVVDFVDTPLYEKFKREYVIS